ncbi:uncharacterized protein YecT (DUF1311 family) [Bradyrhizobium yuanmingense]|uniref:Uncharacterized protein YecT (DUF1311 family) n=2 Tax=Bradyrhizobium yuanmingense TaxID=108015 RepID=A0ABV4GGL4_9BRAD
MALYGASFSFAASPCSNYVGQRLRICFGRRRAVHHVLRQPTKAPALVDDLDGACSMATDSEFGDLRNVTLIGAKRPCCDIISDMHPILFKTVFSSLIGLILFVEYVAFTGASLSSSTNTQLFPKGSTSAELTGSADYAHSASSTAAASSDNFPTDYAWRANELSPEYTQRIQDQLTNCISASEDPSNCVGITYSSNCSTTVEQCAYAEAGAWDEIGKAAYAKLLEASDVRKAAEQSQAEWKTFSAAECSLVGALYQTDAPRYHLERANCALELSSARAISLRDYVLASSK